MHLANCSSRKPDTLSQGSIKLDKLSQGSMGDTSDKKGSHRPTGAMNPKNPENPDKKQNRGEC